MKKLFLSLVLLVVFSYSSTAQVTCRDFSIGLGGFFTVGTTVYVCCGGPYSGVGVHGCSFVNKRTFEMWTSASPITMRYDGIPLKELYPGKDLTGVTYVIVERSSSSKLEDGSTMSIKKGKYMVNKDGLVFLEIEVTK